MNLIVLQRLSACAGVLALSACVGPLKHYTAPISGADILPNGIVSEIQANPKRSATSVEVDAIQRAVRTNPLFSPEVAVSGVWVEAVNKPVVGFCGRLQESGDAESVITGVLKSVEGNVLAYDLRYGEQARLRCSYMNFWADSQEAGIQ